MKMKKYCSIILALVLALALTACGAGETESVVSSDSSADAPAAVETETHAYSAADLEGVVKLDGFGVIQGSVDIDLTAAIEYDGAIVTDVDAEDSGVSYEQAKAQKVKYIITVNKAALDERLGLDSQEDGEELTVEMTVIVPVVAPGNGERFLGLNEGMVLLTDGNAVFTAPAAAEDPEPEAPDADEGGAETPAEGEGEVPGEADGSGTSGTAPSDTGSQSSSGSSGSTGGSGSSGSSGSSGDSGSSGGSGGSGSGSSGSSGGDSGSSGGGDTHTHDWVEQTTQQWVVDQAAWDEPVYEYKEVCNLCGAYYDTADEVGLHILWDHDGGASYSEKRVQTGTVHHDEEGHYETVVTGYICSICGATQ